MVGRTTSDSVMEVAAFGAVGATVDFATGLFNFLFAVVMASVGAAMGVKDRRLVELRLRQAMAASLGLGLVAALTNLSLRQPVFGMMGLRNYTSTFNASEAANRSSSSSPAAGSPDELWSPVARMAWCYYTVKCATMPAIFGLKVVSGGLAGLQQSTSSVPSRASGLSAKWPSLSCSSERCRLALVSSPPSRPSTAVCLAPDMAPLAPAASWWRSARRFYSSLTLRCWSASSCCGAACEPCLLTPTAAPAPVLLQIVQLEIVQLEIVQLEIMQGPS
jgi:hypothetical protein